MKNPLRLMSFYFFYIRAAVNIIIIVITIFDNIIYKCIYYLFQGPLLTAAFSNGYQQWEQQKIIGFSGSQQCIVQYSTVQYGTVLYCIVVNSSARLGLSSIAGDLPVEIACKVIVRNNMYSIWYSTVQYCTIQYIIVHTNIVTM